MSHGQHGQRCNLREFSDTMDFRDFPSVLSLQGSSARPSDFLDAETCEFPSLSMLPV